MERPKFPPREGDVLILLATVRHDFDGANDEYLFLEFVGQRHRFSLPFGSESVVGFHRRAWKKGDQVKVTGPVADVRKRTSHLAPPVHQGTVIATDGDAVWVKFGAVMETHSSINLEPVEPVPETPEAVQAAPEPPPPFPGYPDPGPVTDDTSGVVL